MIKRQALKKQTSYKRKFEDVFTGVGCFDGMFSFKVKPDSNHTKQPYGV